MQHIDEKMVGFSISQSLPCPLPIWNFLFGMAILLNIVKSKHVDILLYILVFIYFISHFIDLYLYLFILHYMFQSAVKGTTDEQPVPSTSSAPSQWKRIPASPTTKRSMCCKYGVHMDLHMTPVDRLHEGSEQ